MAQSPLVSVVIPAFRATETLPDALASIRSAGLAADQLEVVIASDDGHDYAGTLPADPMLRFTPPGPVQSGAGAARNRAMAIARGYCIAFLDADDTWAPGYLAALLPLARRHGAAFGASAILQQGREILRLPPASDRLTLADLGRTGASFHPVVTRDQARAFTDHLSQDVRHAAELLARLGGSAPLGPATYRIHLRPASTTAAADFAARVERAYAAHVSEIEAGGGDIPAALRARVAQVFRDKAALNAAYMAEGAGQSFYGFVAARLNIDILA